MSPFLDNPDSQSNPPQPPEKPSQTSSITIDEGRRRMKIIYFGNRGNFDTPYGFRMYRTTYGDDEKWDRFMSYYKANVEKALEHNAESRHELSLMDWTVQSGPELHGATTDQIREKFIEWVDSGEEQPENSSRFAACIVVDEDALDSVMCLMELLEEEGEPIYSEDPVGAAYVTLVSRYEEDEDSDVCIQNLYPTAFDFVYDLGWRFIEPEEGEFVARPR